MKQSLKTILIGCSTKELWDRYNKLTAIMDGMIKMANYSKEAFNDAREEGYFIEEIIDSRKIEC